MGTGDRSRQAWSTAASMAPLRLALGARQPAAEALGRMEGHSTEMAPVLDHGHPIGVLTRRAAATACAFGLGGVPAGELVVGGTPTLRPEAGLREALESSRCVAPALLVRPARGPLLGLLARERLDPFQEAAPVDPAAAAIARRWLGNLEAPGSGIARHVAALAGRAGVPVYLVGGTVRDLILAGRPGDLDLGIEGETAVLARQIAGQLGGPVTLHRRFGTAAIALTSGETIDLARARRETYASPAALPEVEPCSIAADLRRRDVTINAMALRLDGRRRGRFRDDLGGRRDLARGIMRVHHALSLAEDPTRIIRIARIAARLGFTLSEETRRSLALARAAGAFDVLTGERILHELGRIAGEPEPDRVLALLSRTGALADLIPGLRWRSADGRWMRRLWEGLRGGPLRGTLPGLPQADLLLPMTIGVEGGAAAAAKVVDRLKLRGRPRERCLELAAALTRLERDLRRARRRSRIARACEAAPAEAIAILWARGGWEFGEPIAWYLRTGRGIRPATTGRDLAALGMPAGPAYAEIQARLREALMDGVITDAEGEGRLLRRLLRHSGQAAPPGAVGR